MSERVQVTWHQHAVSRAQREALNGHAGAVVWFTGLSGCGKSTIANTLDQKLHARSIHTFLLDGDNVRMGLNAAPQLLEPDHGAAFAQRFGLGFGPDDRQENIRRVAAVAQLFASAGLIVLTAFVSPYRRDRDLARRLVESAGRPGDFIEVFVDTPLEVCEQRDPKGLYRKARAGQIKHFTGIDDPYEPPQKPELVLRGGEQPPRELADQVLAYLVERGHLGSTKE